MNEKSIKIVGLGKRYKIGAYTHTGSFREVLSTAAKDLAGIVMSSTNLSPRKHKR